MVARTNPVLAQLGLVRLRPLDHEPLPTGRQSPCESRQGAHRITALVGYEDEVAAAFWESVGYPRDREIGRRVRNLQHTRSCSSTLPGVS
jgi:hypothetical protein